MIAIGSDHGGFALKEEVVKYLKGKGFTINEMITANVIGKSQKGTYYDRFRKRVMFPIINIRGNVVGFSGRAMPGDDKAGGKYVNTSDTPVYKKSENLFGINYAKNNCSEQIILVEGNMDVISLHQAGFNNAVAPLGTAFTSEQVNLIARYTKEIVLMLDSDAAGQKAIARASQLLEKTGLNIRVVVIPDGKDPDEFIKKNGPDRFRALLTGAVSDIEYKLLMAADGLLLDTDDGRLKYLNKAAQILSTSNDSMTRDIYIGRLCEKYSVSRTALTEKVNEYRRQNKTRAEKKEINDIIRPKYTKDDINPERRLSVKGVAAEEMVLSVLLQHPDFIKGMREALPPDKMITDLNRRAYSCLLEAYENGNVADISLFAQSFSVGEVGYLVTLQNSDKAGNNAKTVLNDCIKVILEEYSRLNSSKPKDQSVEDWASQLQEIIKNKNKGNGKNG